MIFAFGGGKPMGTRGFAGAIATDNKNIAHRIDCALNMGKPGKTRYNKAETLGFRGASQELQCGLVYAGFKHLKRWHKQSILEALKYLGHTEETIKKNSSLNSLTIVKNSILNICSNSWTYF